MTINIVTVNLVTDIVDFVQHLNRWNIKDLRNRALKMGYYTDVQRRLRKSEIMAADKKSLILMIVRDRFIQ